MFRLPTCVVLLALLSASSRKHVLAQQSASPHLESMGSRPIVSYEFLDPFSPSSKYRAAATPVGEILIQFPNNETIPYCSGIVISSRLVLTARHCLQFTDPDTQESEPINPKSIVLVLDHLKNVGDGTQIRLEVGPVEKGGGDLDYMLLRSIAPIPLEGRQIPSAGKDPAALEDLYVIHHPTGLPLVISRQGCRATDKPIEGDLFHHLCDTREISSGAPVFDMDFHLVGIHLAGGKSEKAGTFNIGLLLSKIMANSSTVKSVLAGNTNISVGTPVQPPRQQVKLAYKMVTGERFAKSDNEWTLSTPSDTDHVSHLKGQASNGSEYVLWDPSKDILYRIPKGGGVVETRRGAESEWTAIGKVTEIH